MAGQNRTLGKFHLDGIPPAPRGVPQVEVTFDIDANGIVNVSAKDKATNKEQHIRIEAGSGISDSDIDRMVSDAKENEADDKKKKDEIETKNQADSLCYQIERNLGEYKDKLDEATRTDIEAKLKATRDAIESGDTDRIKSEMEALTQASHKMAEMMYQSAAAGAPGANPGEPGPTPPPENPAGDAGGKGNVVDAEFEETN